MNYTNSKSLGITRRGLLSAASAIAVLSLTQMPGRAFAANLDLKAFLSLSQKLVGQDDLSEDIAAEMLKAFGSIGNEDDLAALADGTDDEALSNAILAAWYTGVSPDPDDLKDLTYTDALMWQAMDYTKPMGYCGGAMGYWAEPPAT
jgi:hypothetical protein